MRTKFWLESPKGRDQSENVSVDDVTISKQILGKQVWRVCISFIWLRIGPLAGCCERGNESSGTVKDGDIHDCIHERIIMGVWIIYTWLATWATFRLV
jgi:hypothetical protein